MELEREVVRGWRRGQQSGGQGGAWKGTPPACGFCTGIALLHGYPTTGVKVVTSVTVMYQRGQRCEVGQREVKFVVHSSCKNDFYSGKEVLNEKETLQTGYLFLFYCRAFIRNVKRCNSRALSFSHVVEELGASFPRCVVRILL